MEMEEGQEEMFGSQMTEEQEFFRVYNSGQRSTDNLSNYNTQCCIRFMFCDENSTGAPCCIT